MEINNNGRNIFNSSLNQESVSSLQMQYNNLSSGYHDFIKNVSKGDFANAPNRYIIEYNLIKGLIELCNNPELSDNLGDWILKQMEVSKKLAEFGLKIK